MDILDMVAARYKASHIANFFLKRAENECMQLTQLKLIKLVYIAQGFSLALLDKPLFEEDIQAWQYGPVIPSLYNEFKHFGAKPITSYATEYDLFGLEPPYFPAIDKKDKMVTLILEKVWGIYKDFTGPQLIKMTHREDSPWSEYFDAPYMNTEIPQEAIKKHFVEVINGMIPRDVET